MENQDSSVMNFAMLKLAIITVGSAQGEIIDVDEAAKFYVDYLSSLTKRQRVDYLDNIVKRYKENNTFTILGRSPEIYEIMAYDAIKINVARIKHYPISVDRSGELLVYENEVVRVHRKKKPTAKKRTVIEINPEDVTIISEEEFKKQEEERKKAKKEGEKEKPKSSSQEPRRKSNGTANEEVRLFNKHHRKRPNGKRPTSDNRNKSTGSKPNPQRQKDVNSNISNTKRPEINVDKKPNEPIKTNFQSNKETSIIEEERE